MKKARLLIGAGETCADILYAGGFNAPDAFTYFEAGGVKGVAVSSLEFSRAVASLKPGVQCFNRDEFIAKGSTFRGELQVLRGISARYGVSAWEVPCDFPLGLADALRSEGISIMPVEGDFMPRRRRKSRAEIAATAGPRRPPRRPWLLSKRCFARRRSRPAKSCASTAKS
jgi:Xaa-Pro aminopeptidase